MMKKYFFLKFRSNQEYDWTDVTIPGVGLLFHMGTIQVSHPQHYYKIHPLLKMECF